jgi:hypothetical protein
VYQLLKGREKALGLDHPLTLGTVDNLSSFYNDQGKLKEAEDVLARIGRLREGTWARSYIDSYYSSQLGQPLQETKQAEGGGGHIPARIERIQLIKAS